MPMMARDEAQKSTNNLYPSFADMQSSHDQHMNSGQGQYSQQYIEQMPDDTKKNRRSERGVSQSKNNDMGEREGSKQRQKGGLEAKTRATNKNRGRRQQSSKERQRGGLEAKRENFDVVTFRSTQVLTHATAASSVDTLIDLDVLLATCDTRLCLVSLVCLCCVLCLVIVLGLIL